MLIDGRLELSPLAWVEVSPMQGQRDAAPGLRILMAPNREG